MLCVSNMKSQLLLLSHSSSFSSAVGVLTGFVASDGVVSELLNSSLALRALLTSMAETSDARARLNGDEMLSISAGAVSLVAGVAEVPLESGFGDASVPGVGDFGACFAGIGGARGSADA